MVLTLRVLDVLLLIAQVIMWALLAALALWTLYLAYTELMEHRADLTKAARYAAYPVIAMGLMVDVLFNIAVGTIMFAQLPPPEAWTLSQRLSATKRTGSGWRLRLALWVCANFVDPFNRGHC